MKPLAVVGMKNKVENPVEAWQNNLVQPCALQILTAYLAKARRRDRILAPHLCQVGSKVPGIGGKQKTVGAGRAVYREYNLGRRRLVDLLDARAEYHLAQFRCHRRQRKGIEWSHQ